jgi:ammonium transporter Rh
VIGRIGPKELLLIAIIQVIGYSLNEIIISGKIIAYDDGGSLSIHAFGAYFGLALSYSLGKKC